MKFKKSWIFWICYYSVAIIGNVLLLILFSSNLSISAYSLFPIGYILLSLYLAWYYPSQFRIKFDQITSIEMRIKYNKEEGIVVSPPPKKEEYWREDDKFASKIFLACIPILFPFIFFLSIGAKIISGLFLLFPYAATTIYCIVKIKKEIDTHQKKLTADLEAQNKKEELGKWK